MDSSSPDIHLVYLALGSNQGDRLANLQQAIASLPPPVETLSSSPIYETPPWGYTDQPPFLNQVIFAATWLSPDELLAYLKQLETSIGRQPTFRYGPRLIDLDILLYDDLILESPDLTIPHPRLSERAFVLVPLADLAPDLRHPITGRSVLEMLDNVDAGNIQRIFP